MEIGVFYNSGARRLERGLGKFPVETLELRTERADLLVEGVVLRLLVAHDFRAFLVGGVEGVSEIGLERVRVRVGVARERVRAAGVA